jgi:hypothetical protein
MNGLRFKWLGPVVMLLTTLLVISGCGGGGGSSSSGSPAKASISGTVTFPTINLTTTVAKQLALATAPTVELRDLNGSVIATKTVTGTGTATDPYKYSFPDIAAGDYIVKVANNGQVLKAVVGKDDLSTTTTTVRDLDYVATAAVIVTEQKLGVPVGTIGETANSVSTVGLAGVQPKTIETSISTAVSTIKTNPAAATQSTVNLVNLTNVVIATVSNSVDTSAFIAGTATTTSVSTTQLTFTATGTAPTSATVTVTPAIAQTVVRTVAPTVVYLQTRSTEASTYVVGWIAVDTSVYSAATLKDASNNTVPTMTTNGSGKIIADYQIYDCFTGTTCVVGAPYQDNGFYSNISALAAGNYNYVLTPVATTTVVNPVAVNYAAASALPVIASANMSATNSGSDISFSWTQPTTAANWSSVGIVKIEIQDTAVVGKKVMINLKPTAGSVTLPNSVITAAGLNPASATLQWRMQTRQSQNGVNIARGVSNWKNIPVYTPPVPPPTTSALQTMMTAGFYEVDNRWNGTQNKNYYYINRIYLPASSSTLAESATYLDPVTKAWISTQPTGFPTSTTYALASTGWVAIPDTASDYSVTFNADGTASLKAAAFGSDAKISMTQTDVSGQQIPANALRGAPLIANPAVFPASSLRYDLAWTQISDDYRLWDTVGSAGSTLTSLLSSTNYFYVEGNNSTYYYNAQFVGGTSNVVNIYQGLRNSTTQQTLIGTATYSITTVRNVQLLEISIPSTLRTAYNLGGNPIFASAPNGFIMEGVHDFPGASSNGTNGGSFNKIAIDHIQANLNTALMKPVAAKSISKSILGR